MTREEVIKQLKKLKSFHNGSYGEAINFAIESIKVDMAYDLAYEEAESESNMTNEEAIETLKVAKSEIEWEYPMDYQIALDKAIKALGKKSILNKVRTEIEHLTYYWCEVNPKTVIDDVLQIIDKYRVESEDEECK